MSDDKDDFELFRESVGGVRRIRSTRAEVERQRIRATPRMREADERRVVDELSEARPFDYELETGEELCWLRPGIQSRVLRRLRRGYWSVQDEIDLHQMNTEAATRSIRIFIDEALASGKRCIRVIHGKGLRSGPAGPRLKTVTARVLSRHPRVLAFASAPPTDGGTGAVYVLLKHSK
ncbi:MAG: Smr/MutS family protein [Wenzhouxiangellaceae bacterium]|jgi:DNA-nicking Smr family endonuclease|nr:Smr/MutS family protein [Wenzhouxiangellaceae bacterium]MBS3822800.1 Smr/MutS family protein [Wenzhouxiangellaceae bacterium]